MEIQWITGKLDPNQEAFVSYAIPGFYNNPSGTFYTDSNGFLMVSRNRNGNGRLEANFYPVTTSIFIQEQTFSYDKVRSLKKNLLCPKGSH